MIEDIRRLEDQLDAAEQDARALVSGLSEAHGTWRASEASWSVAECFDHLASTNRIYVEAMRGPATQALKSGRRGALRASPGFVGRLFIYSLEPPVKPRLKGRAPAIIWPRTSVQLADAFSAFSAAQTELRGFVQEYAGIDLSGVMFASPFLKHLRISLASGLYMAAAHERRHLWQGWNARRAAESQNGMESHVAAIDSRGTIS